MKLSIFSRLIIGYTVVLLLMVAVGIYAILKLSQFTNVTRSILDIDNRIIEYEKKITDAFLSQIRSERKYIIISNSR